MTGKTLPTPAGYRAFLDGQEYPYIGWRTGLALHLARTNKNKAHCHECKRELMPGEGIYKSHHGDSGYICIEAARKIILTVGNFDGRDSGYTVNILDNLQKCSGDYGVGKYTSQQVADSIQKSGRT